MFDDCLNGDEPWSDFDDSSYEGDFEYYVENFHWRTQEGEVLTPPEMETSHIFNCVRMIFNHTAPEEMKLRPFKHWPSWEDVPAIQKRVCVMAFLTELSRRTDLNPSQLSQLRHMAVCASNAWPETAQLALLYIRS